MVRGGGSWPGAAPRTPARAPQTTRAYTRRAFPPETSGPATRPRRGLAPRRPGGWELYQLIARHTVAPSNRPSLLIQPMRVRLYRCDTGFTVLNPAYQNPDRRGRAEVTIKHADIHLRIRTLIAEDGRKLRAATGTIKDEKAADHNDSMVSAFCTRVSVTSGCPEVTRVHVKQMIVPTIICRARSTLRALFRMAVPPVLSSTSAEYSLQEV